jgi:hypothetical protein
MMVLPNNDVLAFLPSLGEAYPELLAEWDAAANGALDPAALRPFSRRHVRWACARCGHRWMAPVMQRTLGGAGCPACDRPLPRSTPSLAQAHPALLGEWHPQRNAPFSPARTSARSNRMVWWRCAAGHEWRASVTHRAGGQGCPACAGLPAVGGTRG